MINQKKSTMRKYFILLLTIGLLALISCREEQKEVDIGAEKAAVENVLEKYVLANENQDFSLIEQIWADDDDIVLLGTDGDEKYKGWNQIKSAIQHQFSEFEDTYISVLDQVIKLNSTGNTAWFSETLNYNFIYHGEAMSFEGIRFTGVLEKNEGMWEMVQGHLSIPVAEGTETESR